MAITIRGGVSINAFRPDLISGLKLWLDANDQSTLFQDSSATTLATANADPIGCWQDKSGNAKNATQTDGTKKPIRTNNIQNGKIGITYDGVNDYLQTADLGLTTQPYSYYFVGKFLAFNGDRRQITGINEQGSLDQNNKLNIYAGSPAGMQQFKDTPTNTFLARIEWNGASTLYQENGVTYTGTTGTGVPNGIYLAAYLPYGAYGNVRHFELCIYNRLLSAYEVTKMTNYLNTKWGVY